jgi:ferredoxin-type protein NapH
MPTANTIVYLMQKFSWILVAIILVFGWTSPILIVLAFACMVGPIIFSFVYGRAWCGNFCPRGSLSGTVLSIISPKKEIPKFFKNIWFRILVLVLIMMLFAYGLNQPHSSLTCLGSIFIKMMAITTIIQICLAVLIHPYAWCTFCPMGTISYCVARAKKGVSDTIKISDTCTSCNACTKNCPAQVDIPSWRTTGEILDADCMKCRKCIKACSKNCLQYTE